MVAISAHHNEATSSMTSKKLSRHLLHFVSHSQPSLKEGVRESRSVWCQALLWPRVGGLEKSRQGSSNQNESQQSSTKGLTLSVVQDSTNNIAVACKRELQRGDDGFLTAEKSSKTSASEDNNLHDLSYSFKKLALSSLRPTVALRPATPLKVPPPVSESPLNILKRASLYQELREFCTNADTQMIMFPEYFSSEDRRLVQTVAQELKLGVQVGKINITVYKRHGYHLQHNRVQQLSSGGIGIKHAAEDVFVDVHALAEHGKDGFIEKLRLRRLGSRTGIRRDMLWDVAELSSTPDGITDPICEGEGGVYAVQSRSSGQKLALFKPAEEEKFKREGLYPGEGAVREEAAYVLDSRSNGFSGVPPTAVARLRLSNVGQPKQGAVQRFMASTIGSMESFGMPFDHEKAREFVPVEQVHRIALLDIRVFNTDRHSGNILLIGEKKPYTMVPIDHGCILPSWFHLSEARFDWLEYPQTREALSSAALKYVDELDAEKDAIVLRSLGIREECVTTLKICTLFLKLAAAQGKSLFWMGNFMTRDGCFQDPSRLENTIQNACGLAGIPYTFKPNEYDEQRGEIELGVLSRRPPNNFFVALEHQLLDAIKNDKS